MSMALRRPGHKTLTALVSDDMNGKGKGFVLREQACVSLATCHSTTPERTSTTALDPQTGSRHKQFYPIEAFISEMRTSGQHPQ